MQRKILPATVIFVVISMVCVGLVIGGTAIWYTVRPQPGEKNEILFQGINYIRDVRRSPRPMVVHIITIDLKAPGISFLVTPGDLNGDLSLKARTTSKFLDNHDLQIAVNGGSFGPWHSNGGLNYYPHDGDPVEPLGLSASQGDIYSLNPGNEPVLYISRTNLAVFNRQPGKIYNAISGSQMLVSKGKAKSELDETPQPRTAIGLDKRGRQMVIVVIDGRQPGYSAGATLGELADILIDLGAYNAMNLDGGGSSTLVMEGAFSRPDVLNSPIEHQIPGRQRVVGNHLGVFAKPAGED